MWLNLAGPNGIDAAEYRDTGTKVYDAKSGCTITEISKKVTSATISTVIEMWLIIA